MGKSTPNLEEWFLLYLLGKIKRESIEKNKTDDIIVCIKEVYISY